MNDIEWIKDQVEQRIPKAQCEYSPVGKDDRNPANAWLDIRIDDKEITIEYRPGIGIGLYKGDEAYGEGPAEVIREKEVAFQKILERVSL